MTTTRTMPVQKPGRSKQDYGTPRELIRAIEARWGNLVLDLAAHDNGDNAKAPEWLGPSDDYLSLDIAEVVGEGLCWCNPPFENIAVWARKWRADAAKGTRIIALTPASVGAEWFADHIEGVARVIALRPRITFEGGGHQKSCCDPNCLGCQTYPKDCMLTLWGRVDARTSYLPGFETWRWDAQEAA